MSGETRCGICGKGSGAAVHRSIGEGDTAWHAFSPRPASPPPAVTGEGMRDDGSEDCDCAEIDAKAVLCRVFDDIDEAYAEWDAFDQSGWFSPARALGAFIRTRQDRLRASGTDERLREERDAWKEIAEARANLLVCYRTGSHRLADKALTRIENAEARLRASLPSEREGQR